MKNITITNHRNAQNELSKFDGDLVNITSYGQQLASWGKSEKHGLQISVKSKGRKNKLHTVNILEEGELNEFSANYFQYQWYTVDNGTDLLFVHHDDHVFTDEQVESLICAI